MDEINEISQCEIGFGPGLGFLKTIFPSLPLADKSVYRKKLFVTIQDILVMSMIFKKKI